MPVPLYQTVREVRHEFRCSCWAAEVDVTAVTTLPEFFVVLCGSVQRVYLGRPPADVCVVADTFPLHQSYDTFTDFPDSDLLGTVHLVVGTCDPATNRAALERRLTTLRVDPSVVPDLPFALWPRAERYQPWYVQQDHSWWDRCGRPRLLGPKRPRPDRVGAGSTPRRSTQR